MGKLSTEYLMLAKGVDYKRITNTPCALSEKIDGVPGVFQSAKLTISRQGKAITSVAHLDSCIDMVVPKHVQIIGELHVPGQPFKVSSGKVRGTDNCPDLHLAIWDVVFLKDPDLGYNVRFMYANEILNRLKEVSDGMIYTVPSEVMFEATPEACEATVKAFYNRLIPLYKSRVAEFAPERPLSEVGEPEGVMIRPMSSVYSLGRSWGLQRYVPKPTADLRVVALEEATANRPMEFLGHHYEEGDGLSAIGALVVNYKGTQIKVGPGAMTHEMRRNLWFNRQLIIGQIIKVKYKADPTYEALREPTFVEIRHDKTIADDEEQEGPDTKG